MSLENMLYSLAGWNICLTDLRAVWDEHLVQHLWNKYRNASVSQLFAGLDIMNRIKLVQHMNPELTNHGATLVSQQIHLYMTTIWTYMSRPVYDKEIGDTDWEQSQQCPLQNFILGDPQRQIRLIAFYRRHNPASSDVDGI